MRQGVLAAAVVAMTLVGARSAHAGGMPLKTYENQLWVSRVLQAEARHLDLETRRVLARAIAEEGAAHDLDPALVLAVIKVESRYRPGAVSPKGARGLMQVMPRTAASFTSVHVRPDQLHEPETNVRLGVALLRRFIRDHHGDLAEGLAAYNMGSSRLRALMRRDARFRPADYTYARSVMREASRLKAAFRPVHVGFDETPAPALAAWLAD